MRPQRVWVGLRIVSASYRKDTPAGRRNRAELAELLHMRRRIRDAMESAGCRYGDPADVGHVILTAAAKTR